MTKFLSGLFFTGLLAYFFWDEVFNFVATHFIPYMNLAHSSQGPATLVITLIIDTLLAIGISAWLAND